MADGFGVDTSEANEIAGKLLGVQGRITSNQTSGPQPGPIGSGTLEEALSEFGTAVAQAQQSLASAIDKSATNFSSLASGATTLDQQEAERV